MIKGKNVDIAKISTISPIVGDITGLVLDRVLVLLLVVRKDRLDCVKIHTHTQTNDCKRTMVIIHSLFQRKST